MCLKVSSAQWRPFCLGLNVLKPFENRGHLLQPFKVVILSLFNTLRPRLNRRPFADDIFKCIFLNENEWVLPRISLKFIPKVRINNIQSLVQIMAWRRAGDKPLYGPMMVSLLAHFCVTRPEWVKCHANDKISEIWITSVLIPAYF